MENCILHFVLGFSPFRLIAMSETAEKKVSANKHKYLNRFEKSKVVHLFIGVLLDWNRCGLFCDLFYDASWCLRIILHLCHILCMNVPSLFAVQKPLRLGDFCALNQWFRIKADDSSVIASTEKRTTPKTTASPTRNRWAANVATIERRPSNEQSHESK